MNYPTGQDGVRWPDELAEKIGYLAAEVESSDDRPTTQRVQVHDELREQEATYRQAPQFAAGKGRQQL